MKDSDTTSARKLYREVRPLLTPAVRQEIEARLDRWQQAEEIQRQSPKEGIVVPWVLRPAITPRPLDPRFFTIIT